MNLFSITKTSFIAILILWGNLAQATSLDFDSLGGDNTNKKQTVVLVDILQPLLFGKVGIGVGWQTIKKEYIFYGNYVYGKGLIPTTALRLEKDENVTFDERKGFDFGFQLKIRSKLLTKPYAHYIKDIDKINRLYYAPWIEVSQKSGSREIIPYYGGQRISYNIWEYKAGLLIGWSIDSRKINHVI